MCTPAERNFVVLVPLRTMPSYSVWFLTRPGSCHPISAASGGTQALNPGFQAFLALHGPTERQSEIWGVAEEKCAALCMEARACCPSRHTPCRRALRAPRDSAPPPAFLCTRPLNAPAVHSRPHLSARRHAPGPPSAVAGLHGVRVQARSVVRAPWPRALLWPPRGTRQMDWQGPRLPLQHLQLRRLVPQPLDGRAAAVFKPPLSRRRAVSCIRSLRSPRVRACGAPVLPRSDP